MKMLVHLLNCVLFLAAWIVGFMALHWLALLLLTQRLDPGQEPPLSFSVVVETRANGTAPSWEARRYHDAASFSLAPGESLQLSTRSFDQADGPPPTGSCCLAFKVLDEGASGQLVQLDYDDMSYVQSRYRVQDGRVTPISNRADFSLYYLGYFLLGGLLAWLATRPIRRRALAWARSRSVAAAVSAS